MSHPLVKYTAELPTADGFVWKPAAEASYCVNVATNEIAAIVYSDRLLVLARGKGQRDLPFDGWTREGVLGLYQRDLSHLVCPFAAV
jgi:hypothetical protein